MEENAVRKPLYIDIPSYLSINMQVKERIIEEIDRIPAEYLDDVLDFIRYLETKAKEKRMETAILSESSLKKDWLNPEEDEAWEDL